MPITLSTGDEACGPGDATEVQADPMKIEPSLMKAAGHVGAQSVQTREVQTDRGLRSTSTAGAGRSSDSAVLSGLAKDVRTAQKAFEQVPDVRAERVEALKQQVAEGTLNVDAELIADKLMQNVL